MQKTNRYEFLHGTMDDRDEVIVRIMTAELNRFRLARRSINSVNVYLDTQYQGLMIIPEKDKRLKTNNIELKRKVIEHIRNLFKQRYKDIILKSI